MLNGLFIFTKTGLPIFRLDLTKDSEEVDEILFAGVASAINFSIKNIGHKKLQTVTTDSGVLIFSVRAAAVGLLPLT